MTDDPVTDFRAGAISAEVAIARLLLAGADAQARVGECAELASLWRRNRDGVAGALAMLSRVDHPARADVAAIAAMFDAAVACAPEASVALYSLGDPATLARATDEVIRWLVRERLVGPDRDVVDLGCGIGRVAARLAQLCRSVLGLDVSAGMVAEARRRCQGGNLRFAVTDGESLRALPDAAFDLILAVDSMPYIVQAGVAESHAADAARVLRPGGALAALNLSYRGPEADRADARAWAARYGLALECDGSRPFTLWDGTAFVWRRPA